MNVTGPQLRAARALVNWSREDLAREAAVSAETVKRIEGMAGAASANVQTIMALRRALDAAGVLFIDENGEGPGVRLRKGAAPPNAKES